MNSIMERFFRTVRREARDKFQLTGKNQVQRIQQQIPKTGEPGNTGGAVRKSPVLGGLHHHYYRQAA